jgi:hypothetical protein
VLATVLTAAAVVAVLLDWWWLAAAALMTLVSATFLVALDADRRVRTLRKAVLSRSDVASSRTAPELTAQPPAVTEADVVGAVRVLQAQYVGRMDRLQNTLDQTLEVMRAEARGDRPSSAADQGA